MVHLTGKRGRSGGFYEIFVGQPSRSGGGGVVIMTTPTVGCGHYDHPYGNDDSLFAKGITKIIIPSAGGVRLVRG